MCIRDRRRTLRGSLRASVGEGMVAEVFTACAGSTALTAWALALKLSPFLVGVMTALPFFPSSSSSPRPGSPPRWATGGWHSAWCSCHAR